MRVTNNMIMKSSTTNVNATKVSVDNKNNQMTTNKKISRPSEDPVVAIRSLRLGTSLNQLDQYSSKNIPDAESWLDVTETAILNMKSIITDVRTQCVTGSTGTLTADDRDSILSQLKSLQAQMYSEGDADYAGRTVFTGFRTNSTLTFNSDELSTKYNIKENFSAVTDIAENRYYTGDVQVPSTQAEVLNGTISDTAESVYNRIRLPYDDIEQINEYSYVKEDGTLETITIDGDETFVDPDTGNTIHYRKNTSTSPDGQNVLEFDNEEDWAAYCKSQGLDTKTVNDGEVVIINQTGEMILGNDVADNFRHLKTTISVDYDKTGFKKGELRPEFYYNCTDNTNPLDPISYQKYDADGKEIKYDIEYNVAANQSLAVNIEASDVFNSGLIQDVGDMINAISAAIDAHDKVDRIKGMMKENQYATDDYQTKLQEWLNAAQKEADYADDNVQKLFSSDIGKVDGYLSDISLAITKVGCKSDQLSITKDRVENQQSTVEELKSNNDDVDLSSVILEYTSAYTAYQASLTAASKLGQVSLLNYI